MIQDPTDWTSKLLSTGFKPKKNVDVAIKEMIKFLEKINI